MGQRKRLRRILSILLAPVGFLAAVLWLVTAVSDLASGQAEQRILNKHC